MAIIPVGKEPEAVKRRMDSLFSRLNDAYPDKVICGLQKNHKKWAETVTELYRLLGYESGNAFLEAYGYTVRRVTGGGRPVSNDYLAIIEELKNRYPNGPEFSTVADLQNANPDLGRKFKSLSNKAKELFGMTLVDYLQTIGVLGTEKNASPNDNGDAPEKEATEKRKLEDILGELKVRYSGKDLPTSVSQLIEQNRDLAITGIGGKIKKLLGEDPASYLKQTGLLGEKRSREVPPPKFDQSKRYKCDQYYFQVTDNGARIVKFTGCPTTDRLVIPDELKGVRVVSIGEEAFARRPIPDTVVLPKHLQVIEADAFANCELKKIIFPNSLKQLKSRALREAFDPYTRKKIILKLPERLEEIGFLALDTRFDEIYVSDSVREISPALKSRERENALYNVVVRVKPGSYAEKYFSSKKGVTLVNWDSSDEEIELHRSFRTSRNQDGTLQIELSNQKTAKDQSKPVGILTLPTVIGGVTVSTLRLDRRCLSELNELHIPATIREISIMEGYGKSSMLSKCHIEIDEANPYLRTDGKLLFNKEQTKLISWLIPAEEYELPDTLLEISDSALQGSPIQSISLPQALQHIGHNAFAGTLLHEVALPPNLQSIDYRAFCPCKHLEKVTGLERIPHIGSEVFEDKVFESLAQREGVEGDEISDFEVAAGILLHYHGKETHPIIPAQVTTIGTGAFKGCTTIEELNLPDSIRTLQGSPFYDCYSLRRLTIGKSLRFFDESAFSIGGANGSLEEIVVDPENAWLSSKSGVLYSKDGRVLYHIPECYPNKELVLPPELRVIRNHAKANYTIEKLSFSSKIELWGPNCFSNYHELQEVVFHSEQEQLQSYSRKAGELFFNFDCYIFSECRKLRTIIWPKSLQRIGNCTFFDCGILHLRLPEGVTSIGKRAFTKCMLRRIELPKTIEVIEEAAFEGAPIEELVLYDTLELGQKPFVHFSASVAQQYHSRIGLLIQRDEEWKTYRVTVLSAQNNTVLRSILMPSSNSTPQHYMFASAWRTGGAFAYQHIDESFSILDEGKTAYALERLMHPSDLSDEKKAEYLGFLQKNIDTYLLESAASGRDQEILGALELELIHKNSISVLAESMDKAGKPEAVHLLMKYGERKYGLSLAQGFRERSAEVASKAPEGYVAKKRTDFAPSEGLPHGNRDYIGFRFRGISGEVQRLADYLGNDMSVVCTWEKGTSELRLKNFQNPLELIRLFPLLRAVGFAENWSTNQVEVIFSECGYSGVTAWEEVGPFDGHHESGDGRWARIQDVTGTGSYQFTWINTGESSSVHYSFPFRAQWDSKDIVLEIDGIWFARNAKSPSKEDKGKTSEQVAFPNEFQTELRHDAVTLTKYTGHEWRVVVPEGIQAIAKRAFNSYGKIEIRLPKTVSIIDRTAFDGCYNLQSLIIDADNPVYSFADGVIFYKKTSLVRCIKSKSGTYRIPEGVTAIGPGAFEGCSNLKAVVVPESVKYIGVAAFMNTRKLDLSLPDSLEQIGGLLIDSESTIRVHHWTNALSMAVEQRALSRIFTDDASLVPPRFRTVKILPYCTLEEEIAAVEENEKRKIEEKMKAEEERRKAEIKKKHEEELRRYNETHKKWEQECAGIAINRSSYVEAKITEEKKRVIEVATKKRDEELARANAIINEHANRRASAQATLSSLGIFKFKQKKAQEEIIAAAAKILEIRKTVAIIESEYQDEINQAREKGEAQRELFQKWAEQKFPLPDEPQFNSTKES